MPKPASNGYLWMQRPGITAFPAVCLAFLCGTDQASGNGYAHLSCWLEYSGAALLPVMASAVMSNHDYRVLFVNADQARSRSSLEVVSIGTIG